MNDNTILCHYEDKIYRFGPFAQDADILNLEEKAKAKFKLVDTADLRIFLVNVPTRPYETLVQRVKAFQREHFRPTEHLAQLVPLRQLLGATPNVCHFNIIKEQSMEIMDSVHALPIFSNRKVDNVSYNCEDTVKNFKYTKPNKSPSDTANNSQMMHLYLQDDKRRTYMGRPSGIPVAIFSPILAKLQHSLHAIQSANLEDTLLAPLDESYAIAALKYVEAAIDVYENERTLTDKIRPPISEILGKSGLWNIPVPWGNDVRPDAIWSHHKFPTAILEIKNHIGHTGDPFLQAIVCYATIISDEAFQSVQHICGFPTILIGVAENMIEIGAALWIGEIHVSEIFFQMRIYKGCTTAETALRLARAFQTVQGCHNQIIEYYERLGRDPGLFEAFRHLYPDPTIDSAADGAPELPELVYTGAMTKEGERVGYCGFGEGKITALFTAKMNETENVVVKITPRYNAEAHKILAARGLAPELHFFSRIVGNMYMVVMEDMLGQNLSTFRDTAPDIIKTKVRVAIKLLHEHDIVFGDIRPSNIMYNQSENRVVLVDFDWPGKHGVARYPITLNGSASTWVDGVAPYRVMLKAHDERQLERLF